MEKTNQALYQPLPPAGATQLLGEYLQLELGKIAAALSKTLDLVENTEEPARVFNGMLRLFDNGDTTYTLAIRMGDAWWALQAAPYTPPA